MSQENAKQGQQEFAAADLQAWNKAANKVSPGGDINNLNWVTPDCITVKPLYTAEDTADLAYTNLRAALLGEKPQNLVNPQVWKG